MESTSPHQLFGNVRANNYVRIDPLTGLMTLKGLARPYVGEFIPLSAMNAAAAPHYDATELGYLFPKSSTAEFLTANITLGNDYASGTSLYPRVVWHQSAVAVPTWKLAYRWVTPGEQVPTAFTTVASTSEEFTYFQGTIQQISNFAAISGTGKKIGGILQVKLYREDGDLNADALATAFGIFKQIDSIGTQTTVRKVAADVLTSASPSTSISSSPSSSISASPSSSPSSSISTSPSASASHSPSASISHSASVSLSASISNSPSASISHSASSSPSASISNSPSSSASTSSSISASLSSSPSASVSASPS